MMRTDQTLHPKIHGRHFGPPHRDDDRKPLAEHGIVTFSCRLGSLYPVEATVCAPGLVHRAIEQIDIVGAKLIHGGREETSLVAVRRRRNNMRRCSITSPPRAARSSPAAAYFFFLAAAAFCRAGSLDKAIADYFPRHDLARRFSASLSLDLPYGDLRYGEKPHQRGGASIRSRRAGCDRGSAHQRHGKELSYNNLLDLAALAIVRTRPAGRRVVINQQQSLRGGYAATCLRDEPGDLDGDP